MPGKDKTIINTLLVVVGLLVLIIIILFLGLYIWKDDSSDVQNNSNVNSIANLNSNDNVNLANQNLNKSNLNTINLNTIINENLNENINQVTDSRILLTPENINEYCSLESAESLEKCRQIVFNYDDANTTANYTNTEKGISVDLPYNYNWGSNEYRINPYDEISNTNTVQFGAIGQGEGGGWARYIWNMYYKEQKSAQQVVSDINSSGRIIIFEPEIVEINGLTVVKYAETGLTDYYYMEVIGEKYNYDFVAIVDNAFDKLETVVKSIKLIGSETDQSTSISWEIYTYVYFTFEYPASWTPQIIDNAPAEYPNDKVKFLDENSNVVALLTCPYVITGYEGGNTIYNLSKSYADGYSAQLITVDYSNDPLSNSMSVLVMKKGDGFNSCQLFSSDNNWDFDDIKTTYKYIYDSLE